VPRTKSTILFLLILGLSLALVAWWTAFQLGASNELAAAGRRLLAGDVGGAANAFGAGDVAELESIANARWIMFASEGLFFGVVLAASGWLYLASVRREGELRAAQDRFLAAATHELKTPLATIVLLLESLRDDRLPVEKRPGYLANGLLEAERLERGLTNVLTAAGLRTTSRATLRQTPRKDGDLVADVRAAVAAIEPRAQATGVTVTLRAPHEAPFSRDPAGLQLVLRNLLDNAVKFSRPGGAIAVELSIDRDDAAIVVRDEGRGMDAEELERAFAPFWRGSDLATGGTGLGLHLVKQIVAAHGGSVTARSDGRDRGSEFVVRLPRAREP